MSDLASILVPADPREYTHERAAWIAEQYSEGDCSLLELYRAHPHLVPSPFQIHRWRAQYPAFDLLMCEAERVRAGNLAESTLAVARDPTTTAAIARTRISAAQWLASRLDRERYGNQTTVNQRHSGSVLVDVPRMTDDELATIAAQARPALEGKAERVGVVSAPAGSTAAVTPPSPPARGATPPV